MELSVFEYVISLVALWTMLYSWILMDGPPVSWCKEDIIEVVIGYFFIPYITLVAIVWITWPIVLVLLTAFLIKGLS